MQNTSIGLCRNFKKDIRGGVAIPFALAVVPMLIGVGAVDL